MDIQTGEGRGFIPVAERIVDAILQAEPYTAMEAGDHRFDGLLPDHSPDGVAGRVAMLRDASRALSQVDLAGLDAQEAVDHEILMATIDRQLFELTEVRAHEWDPLTHNPGPLLHALIARPYAPPAERLTSIAERLRAIPDTLAIARTVLRDCPQVHLETAMGQFAGTASLIRDGLPPLAAQAPSVSIDAEAEAAISALNDFVSWLGDQKAGRDPRLGRSLWEARLWHTLDTELGAAEILDRAWSALDRVSSELRSLTGDSVRLTLDRLGDEHPDDSTIVELARHTFDEATTFVAEHDLASLIDDDCVIEEMPEFNRGIAGAYCDPPGPLETADVPTFYHISPPPADWTPERIESYYREYNNHMIRNLTVHEAMPGHFLQLAASRRFRGPTRVRALGFSWPFVEGWAVYAEEVMVEHGFGGLPVKLQQLKMQLRMVINAIIDQLIHCENMTETEAMELMMERGYQEEGEAAEKWRRALLTSTQLSTYFVGYSEVSAIAAARPSGTSLREWHDAMLAYGSPPPRHLRTLLGLT